jgi:phosphoglycerol transferase MdoB-like AlkP superfamily enzyme
MSGKETLEFGDRRETWLPRPVRVVIPFVAVGLVVLSILRWVFWRTFAPPDPIPGIEMAKAFYVGAKLDLRLLLVVATPLLLLAGWRWFDPFSGGVRRTLWSLYFTAATLFVLIAHAVDFGHYAYLEARLNASVLQYIENPKVSLRMIWETYPVVWAGIGFVLFAAAVLFGFGWLMTRGARRGRSTLRPLPRIGVAAACTLLVLAGLYGKVSRYPLRWSDAFFSTDPFVCQAGLDPVLMFFDTLGSRTKGFDLDRVRDGYDVVADYLGMETRDPARLSFARQVRPAGLVSGTPNVVVILLESFATYKVGLSGNPLGPTPRFDALAREGILFPRFYVPTHGTARSVFTLVTGIPDVDPVEASSRNPLAVRQSTIIGAFPGYEKLYFLGGSATWGNIRGLLRHNIPGLRLFEEGDYEAPPVDVWGISDLNLFEAANRELARLGDRPFFAIIQTSGHHRPYTIPADNRGFTKSGADDAAVKRNGFSSAAELDAFRFLDHSLGLFFDWARKERYFANTIFVMFGDHGYPGRAQHVPRGEVELGLVRYHVPFLIYAPSLLPGGRVVQTVGSEVDVLPTIAGICGRPYVDRTLGRDLFDPRFEAARYAFTLGELEGESKLGLVGSSSYLRAKARGGKGTLHLFESATPLEDVSGERPEEARKMEQLGRAILETSRYLITHNFGDGHPMPASGASSPPPGARPAK